MRSVSRAVASLALLVSVAFATPALYQATRTEPRLVGGLAASGPYAAWAVGGGVILATSTATGADRSVLPLLPRGAAE